MLPVIVGTKNQSYLSEDIAIFMAFLLIFSPYVY